MKPDHELHLGDCLAGMAGMPDRSVASFVMDPPYEEEAHTLQRRTKSNGKAGKNINGDQRVIAVEPLSFAPITEAIRDESARQAARIARRWIVVFCQAEAVAAWRDSLARAGAVYKRACVWVKPDAMPQLTGDRPGMGYESIVVAHAPGRSRWNGGGKVGVYTFNKNKSDLDRTGHPTQKPLALMEALVADFTDPGELICDPFAGSGTTGVACKRLGRRFIGWERDPAFHASAVRRLDAAREQLSFPQGKRTKPRQSALALGKTP